MPRRGAPASPARRGRAPSSAKPARGYRDLLLGLSTLRHEFVPYTTIDDAAKTGCRLALDHLKVQSAGLFLFNKRGLLERIELLGKDQKGRPLNNKSIIAEAHPPGGSFTGTVVTPTADSAYGRPQWFNKSSAPPGINEATKANYKDVLGKLSSALAVPLNGRHRSFGALEVINKKNPVFTVRDVAWLVNVAQETATAISVSRRQARTELFSALAKAASSPKATVAHERAAYAELAGQLTRRESPYSVCFIRLASGAALELVANQGELPFEGADDAVVAIDDSLPGKVFTFGQRFFCADILAYARAHREILPKVARAPKGIVFSYACLPLKHERLVLGTLSLFVGYRYQVDPDEWEFLGSVADILAALVHSRLTRRRLQKMMDEDVSDAQIAMRSLDIHHAARSGLDFVVNGLQALAGKDLAAGAAAAEYRKIVTEAEAVDHLLKDVLESGVVEETLDINEVLRTIAEQSESIPFPVNVSFKLQLDATIPPVTLDRGLRWVLKDTVHNAMRAIGDTGQDGWIRLSTGRAVESLVRYFEIICEDNGCGIPADLRKDIFAKGFSTRPGGTGFGLFLAKRFLTMQGGGIEVMRSDAGKGTIMRLLIPERKGELG